uniref:Uncharacterized protein n=1 Tax=viral metagenome TaxID=1070528 RepID=A0A6C0HEI3_9ZZZZ
MSEECSLPQQSWTRPRMDPFHSLDDMRITSFALRYYINPPEANCPSMFPVEPTTRIQMQGNSWPQAQWRTDIETDLKGINRFGNRVRCDEKLYNPEQNKFNSTPLEHAQDGTFPLNFNRLHNPPCTLRATGWNRWDTLFHNPQETFEQPFDWFVPARLLDKERTKSKPRYPNQPPIPPYNSMKDTQKFGDITVPGSVQGRP